MDYPSGQETTFQRDFDDFIDPALLALPAPPAVPGRRPSHPFSTIPEHHRHGLAAESSSPTNLRQGLLGGNPPVKSAGHTSSNRRQNREFRRHEFSHTTLTGTQYHS